MRHDPSDGFAGHLMTNGVSTYVERTGHGPAIVLIHPLGGSLRSWDGIRERLVGGADVVAYDWGGHGRSEKPVGEASIAGFAADLVDLMRRLVLSRALLVGVAAGAGIALQTALDVPDVVTGLVLVSPCARVRPEAAEGMAARAEQVRGAGMRVAVEASVEAGLSQAFRSSHADAATAYRHEFLANAPESYARASNAFGRFDVEASLDRVHVPCRLLPGELDPYFPPENALEMARRMPRAEVTVLTGASHFGHLESPGTIVEAIRRALDVR